MTVDAIRLAVSHRTRKGSTRFDKLSMLSEDLEDLTFLALRLGRQSDDGEEGGAERCDNHSARVGRKGESYGTLRLGKRVVGFDGLRESFGTLWIHRTIRLCDM